MKKFRRGSLGRSLSMILMVLFMVPSLLMPLTTRGTAAIGGHINILFMPLDLANADAPQNLSTRILQELQIALAQREGVQVTELLKNSPMMKRALEAVGEENKQDLLDKYNDAANVKLSPDARKNAAGTLVRALGVDAIVYGAIDNYEFTTKPDKNRTYIKVTAQKVTVLEDGTAVVTPLTAIGYSWPRPDGKGDQVTHDLEAIQAVSQNLALQLTGRRDPKQAPDKNPWWRVFGNGTSTNTMPANPTASGSGPIEGGRTKPRSSWLLVTLLGLAVVAAVAGGGGGSDDNPVDPPPIDDGTGYAYPESDGDIRLEIVKPAAWDSVASFQIWRDATNEARGQTTMRTKVRSSRALGLVNVTNRDDATVQGDKVILYDTAASYGYVYTYRVVVVSTSNAKSNITIYNGQAPLMLLSGVGPYVPPPVEYVYAPPANVSNGRATLYWYMPGESIVQPPMASYAMPSYVTGFVVQVEDEGTGVWTTVATGIGKNIRTYQVPVPSANTLYRYTVRAVSSTLGLMYPLEALTAAQQNQVIAEVTSDQGYQPNPPSAVTITPVINGLNPDKIDMRISWTAPTDQQVTGYRIYRRTTGSASMRSQQSSGHNIFRRSRLIGDQQLLMTVSGHNTTTWTDSTLSGEQYGTAYTYTVTSLAFGSAAESTGVDKELAVTAIAPLKPTLSLIPDPDDPQDGAFQIQWAVPTDAKIYGYQLWRAESIGSGSSRGPRGITGSRTKLPGINGGRSQRGRGAFSIRSSRVDGTYTKVFETAQRTKNSYIDQNLVASTTYTYVLKYRYLGSTDGGPDSPTVSRKYDVLPGDATGLNLSYPDGTVYLNWTAPTTNVDGSPLDDPQEFFVYKSTTQSLMTGTNPTVDAATLASKFTKYATVEWGTMDPRNYHDTASFPARSVTSYVIVAVDAANQVSPGPYEIEQLSLMPPSQNLTITPGLLLAKAGDPAQQLVATAYGTDGEPLPDIPITLTCSPATAGSLSLTLTGTYSQQIELVTDVTGTATCYWKPPTNPATASDIGTITAVITGTSISYIVYMSIQPPMPQGYKTVESVNLAINAGQPSRIYFSQDIDDLLSDSTVTSSVLQVTGNTTGGAVASYGRLRINTDRGGFEKMAVDQVVSADRKSIVGVLDENGHMYVRYIGRVDNGITDPFIRLPVNNDLGNPIVTAEDTYTSGSFPITGAVPQLVGPPYTLAVTQGTTAPATPLGWPDAEDPTVLYQIQTTTAEAKATDRLGQPVLQGMPIWFTQSWRPFNPALDPYDYNGALGHGSVAGAYSGPVSLTDANGVARAGFASNHSGVYDIRAFALLKTFNINVLNSYNLNSTGGLPTSIPAGDPLLNNLLWNSADGPATPERVITEKISVTNKTLAYYDHWQVLEVSDGTTSFTNFAEFLNEEPPVVINCDGSMISRITFTATDEDSKKVWPGVPFKVHSMLNQFFTPATEHGFLQLDGDQPDVNRAGDILTFDGHSQAYVVSRGEREHPWIGTVRLRFDNLRTVQPMYTYPGYLVGHEGPRIFSVTPYSIYAGNIDRADYDEACVIGSLDADATAAVPRSVVVEAALADADDNNYPGNYPLQMSGRGFVAIDTLDEDGMGTFDLPAQDLDEMSTPGFDEVNNVQPRPFMSDVVDTGPTILSDRTRNLRIVAYGNPWEPSREDWPLQYVAVMRPHRLTDLMGTPDGMTLPFKDNNWDMNVRVWQNLLIPGTVGAGWNINWRIWSSLGALSDSTITAETVTNQVGEATNHFVAGTKPETVQIQAFYDTDNDGWWDAGTEPSIVSGQFYVGLNKPTGLVGVPTRDDVTGEHSVTLTWMDVPGAARYELRQGNDTIDANATSPYVVHNLAANTTYSFSIRAISGEVMTDWVAVTVKTLADPVPPTP